MNRALRWCWFADHQLVEVRYEGGSDPPCEIWSSPRPGAKAACLGRVSKTHPSALVTVGGGSSFVLVAMWDDGAVQTQAFAAEPEVSIDFSRAGGTSVSWGAVRPSQIHWVSSAGGPDETARSLQSLVPRGRGKSVVVPFGEHGPHGALECEATASRDGAQGPTAVNWRSPLGRRVEATFEAVRNPNRGHEVLIRVRRPARTNLDTEVWVVRWSRGLGRELTPRRVPWELASIDGYADVTIEEVSSGDKIAVVALQDIQVEGLRREGRQRVSLPTPIVRFMLGTLKAGDGWAPAFHPGFSETALGERLSQLGSTPTPELSHDFASRQPAAARRLIELGLGDIFVSERSAAFLLSLPSRVLQGFLKAVGVLGVARAGVIAGVDPRGGTLLEAFLARPALFEGAARYPEVNGFLRAPEKATAITIRSVLVRAAGGGPALHGWLRGRGAAEVALWLECDGDPGTLKRLVALRRAGGVDVTPAEVSEIDAALIVLRGMKGGLLALRYLPGAPGRLAATVADAALESALASGASVKTIRQGYRAVLAAVDALAGALRALTASPRPPAVPSPEDLAARFEADPRAGLAELVAAELALPAVGAQIGASLEFGSRLLAWQTRRGRTIRSDLARAVRWMEQLADGTGIPAWPRSAKAADLLGRTARARLAFVDAPVRRRQLVDVAAWRAAFGDAGLTGPEDAALAKASVALDAAVKAAAGSVHEDVATEAEKFGEMIAAARSRLAQRARRPVFRGGVEEAASQGKKRAGEALDEGQAEIHRLAHELAALAAEVPLPHGAAVRRKQALDARIARDVAARETVAGEFIGLSAAVRRRLRVDSGERGRALVERLAKRLEVAAKSYERDLARARACSEALLSDPRPPPREEAVALRSTLRRKIAAPVPSAKRPESERLVAEMRDLAAASRTLKAIETSLKEATVSRLERCRVDAEAATAELPADLGNLVREEAQRLLEAGRVDLFATALDNAPRLARILSVREKLLGRVARRPALAELLWLDRRTGVVLVIAEAERLSRDPAQLLGETAAIDRALTALTEAVRAMRAESLRHADLRNELLESIQLSVARAADAVDDLLPPGARPRGDRGRAAHDWLGSSLGALGFEHWGAHGPPISQRPFDLPDELRARLLILLEQEGLLPQ